MSEISKNDLRNSSLQTWLKVFGLALIGVWSVWWIGSINNNRLIAAEKTWVPAYHFLGVDFLHNYNVARLWLEGGNPYQEFSGAPLEIKYPYPPLVIRLFAWCNLFSPGPALLIWITALMLMTGIGAWFSWQTRQELGLSFIPFAFILAAVLFSTPVVYAIERGNHDLLVLLCVILASVSLRDQSDIGDILAGIFLSIAAWAKVYPGFLVLGILVLRRWRAVFSFIIVSGLFGAMDLKGTFHFVENLRLLIAQTVQETDKPIALMSHSLGSSWISFWKETPLRLLTKIPGTLAACYVLLPPVLWVSYCIYRSSNKVRLIYPYLTWLAAVATFFPSISSDYNLVFLPLAAIAVWDRKDPFYIQVMMVAFLIYWQPFYLPLGGAVLFVFKLLGIFAVSLSILRRTKEAPYPIDENLSQPGTEMTPIRQWKWYQTTRAIIYFFVLFAIFMNFSGLKDINFISPDHNDEISFSRTIEAVLPKRAMILQLPFIPFSESPPEHNISDGFFWGHLYSKNLRWSYAVRGKEGHFLQNLIMKPLVKFVEAIALAGFDGISIDRYGYADSGKSIEGQLIQLLGLQPFVSVNQRYAFFNMGPFKERLQDHYTSEDLNRKKYEANYPLIFDWKGGFLTLEGMLEGNNWRWSSSEGDLFIFNPSQEKQEITLEMAIATYQKEPSLLKIESPWFSEKVALNNQDLNYSKTFKIPPGRHMIRFISNAKRFNPANDDRELVFKIMNFRLMGST